LADPTESSNVVFVLLFLVLDIGIFLLAGGYFKTGDAADPNLISNIFVASGAFLFGKQLPWHLCITLANRTFFSVDHIRLVLIGELSKQERVDAKNK
jgi:hypothetical protein